MGLRVRLGQEPGHLHHHPFIPPQPRRTRDGPSRQRRRARRAATRKDHAEEAAEEVTKEDEIVNSNEAVEADVVEVSKSVQAGQTEEVADEFCPNDDLNDDNSVTFRFIIEDPVLSKSCDAFESQVKENFVDTKVKASDQFYVISGYEQLENHSKFYLKIKTSLKC